MALLDFLNPKKRDGVYIDKHAFSQLKKTLSKLPEQKPLTILGSKPFMRTEHSIYENLFPYIRPQIDLAKTIVPKVKDSSGKLYDLSDSKLPQALNVLYSSPNSEMDFSEFVDTSLSKLMSMSEFAILVNFSSNNHSLYNVVDYQFLPLNSRRRDKQTGEVHYEWTDGFDMARKSSDDVMLFRFSRLPEDIDRGFSPGCAIRKWADIDDYIADYERGFLENGAFLGVIVSVPADTEEQFEKKTKKLEEDLQGAKNANKIVFVKKTSNINGDAQGLDFQIVQSTNQQLSLDQLNEMTTRRMSDNVGTPSSFLGNDAQPTYANSETAKENFYENKVQPLLNSFWGKFGRELARVTNSAGWEFVANIESPEVTDREKTRAETEGLKIDSLIKLIEAGATGLAASKALKMNNDFSAVAIQIAKNRGAASSSVDMTAEDNSAPALTQIFNMGDGEKDKEAIRKPQTTESRERRVKKIVTNRGLRKFSEAHGIEKNAAQRIDQQDFDELVEIALAEALATGITTQRQIAQKISEKVSLNYRVGDATGATIEARVVEYLKDYDRFISELPPDYEIQDISSDKSSRGSMAAIAMIWGAHRLAQKEVVEIEKSLYSQYIITMTWYAQPDACPFCTGMNGSDYDYDAGQFTLKADLVMLDDGRLSEPDAHPHCRCQFRVTVRRV